MLDLGIQFAMWIVQECFPFVVVLGITELAINIFCKAAFRGRIEII